MRTKGTSKTAVTWKMEAPEEAVGVLRIHRARDLEVAG
jgi:hypothetical protein